MTIVFVEMYFPPFFRVGGVLVHASDEFPIEARERLVTLLRIISVRGEIVPHIAHSPY